MRHNKKRGMKLGTDASHTKAIKKGLICALLANDRIKTLESRAKAIRPDVDKVITWAKKGDLHSRRLAITMVGDADVVAEVFDKAAQGLWADRNGGYTRIMKLGRRKGDNAEVVIIELVTEPVRAKAAPEKAEAKPVEAETEVIEVEDEEAIEVAEDTEDEAEAEEPEAEAEEAVEAEEPAAEEPAAEEQAE